MKKTFIILSLLFFLASNSCALNLGEIRGEIRRYLKDNITNTQQQRRSNTVLNLRINVAQREIAAITKSISSTTYTTTSSGTDNYTLPSDVVVLHRVSYSTASTNNAYEKLEQVLLGQLDIDETSWESTSDGEPTRFFVKDRKIYLLPAPNATWAGTNRLKEEYFQYPVDLSSDSDIPFNSSTDLYPYHNTITYYVLAQTFMEMGDGNSAAYWEKKYSDLMALMFNNLMFKPDWQSSFSAPK